MLNSLTSFRFIAALMVFLFHLGIFKEYQLGSAGVSFFFVLSGFILAYNYHSKFLKLDKTNLKKFYIARFAKIYPVHFLTFLISAPLVLAFFHPDGLYFIKLAFMSTVNLLLIQSFTPFGYFNFNGVSWTLSVEAFFYLTFPILIWISMKLSIRKNLKKTVAVFVVIWLGLFIVNMGLEENDTFFVWLLHIFPVARLFEFSIGILLGLIFIEKSKEVVVNRNLFTIVELFGLILFLCSILLSAYLDIAIVRGVYFVPIWCILIYTFAFEGGVVSRILSQRFLVYLGEISFSFYMIHQLVIRYFSFLNLNETVNFLICAILSLGLSILIYQYYEEPLRKRIRFGKRQKNRWKFRPNI